MLSVPVWCAVLADDAMAACTSSADLLTLNCSGTLTTPITVYDPAAAFQPVNGSNSYTPVNPAFPAASNPNNPGYDPNPPTVTLNFDNTTVFNITTNSSASLADRGMVAANFSNTENPAVNNVVLNNAGSIGLTTSQISSSRLETIVADSQVNTFTVNNTGTISVTQNFFGTFNTSNLSVTSSGSPATYAAKYSGATLNDMAALYSDDNTSEFVINNAASGQLLATGNYATVYYGRADTTITNSGTIANTSWTPSDTIGTGHWAIATWAGTDYVTAPNTNPDSTVVLLNSDGSVTIQDTSATTITNNKTGVIKGDILALDITPTVYAAGIASGATFPLAISGSNAGPRDTNIQNFGEIDGNFYLGSGTHVIDNAQGATINGNFNVDQRASQASFATPNAGSAAGTYLSQGGTDFNGNACPTAGQDTTNPGCAGTHNVLATFVGGQSFTLTNEGTLNGDIIINDQPTSVNSITLTDTGFSGNIIALNGTGSNSLVLSGVSNLASVNNFSFLDLTTSQVTVTPNATTVTQGVSLVDGATLGTTIFGAGGTTAAPSTNLGSLAFVGGNASNTLTLQGATTIVPTFAGIARNGDVYQLASSVDSAGPITVQNTSALVNMRADTSTGALLLDASVMNPAAVPGISKAGGATLANLLGSSGSNPALQALGGAVESLTSLNDVRNAGEQLRPDVSGATIQVPIDITYAFQSQIGSRLDSLFFGALAAQQGRSADYSPPRAPVIIEPYNGVWVNGLGANTQQHTVDAVAGYRADTGGFIAGYDRLFQNTIRLGGAFGYATSEINNSVLLGNRESLQTYQGLVYGQLVLPQGYVNGSFGVGNLEYNTKRTINFPGFADVASASYGGMIYSGRLDAGYPVVTSLGIFVPVAAVTYAHVDQDAYTELSAAGSGLTIAKQSTDSVRSGLGLKAIFPFYASATFGAALETRAVWQHEFENTAQSISAGFVGGDGSFLTTGPTPTRDMADLGAALRLSLPRIGDSLSVSYNAIVRQSYVEQVGMLRARVDF